MPLLLIFLAIPLVEIGVFIAVGEQIGLFTTLALAFLTAILGGIIIRYQGLETFAVMRSQMDRGAMPLKEIFDGFCLVAAGALLITPGFVTDTLGFLLLVPQMREILRGFLGKHIKTNIHPARPRDPNIIEADYIDITVEEREDDKP